jgi:hypothetical protein
MNLTHTQRVIKLAGALIRQPQFTPPLSVKQSFSVTAFAARSESSLVEF